MDIQKFGTQASKARVIRVFRNGDKHHKGEKITLNPQRIKTMDQLNQLLSREVGLVTGAVRKVYTVEGRLIKTLEAFADGAKYIACAGEALKMDALPLAAVRDEPEMATPLSPEPESRGAVAASSYTPKEKKEITKFGTQGEKARVIRVFRNGDKYHKGEKITLNPQRIKTMDQLNQLLSREVGLVTGAVRKVYTVEGKIVKTLDAFKDGTKYIACAGEALKMNALPLAAVKDDAEEPAPVMSPQQSMSELMTSPKAVSREPKEITLFGTQAEKARVIRVFRNGDKYHKGEKITLNPLRIKTMDQLNQLLSREVGLVTGAVRKVYTVEGKIVKKLESFKDGAKYIACAGEALKMNALPLAAVKDEPEMATPLSPEPESRGAAAASYTPKEKKEITKFGTQGEKARVIRVFRNGDKNHKGEKITLNPQRIKTMDQLNQLLSREVGLVTGAVRKVYTPDGKIVKKLDSFADGGAYVACAGEALKKDNLPVAISRHG